MKVLILVLCSRSRHYPAAIGAVRSTWGSVRHPDVEIAYYYGAAPGLPDPGMDRWLGDGDTIVCGCADGEFFQIARKTVIAFEAALATRRFDYLYRVNCTSYVDQAKLHAFLRDRPRRGYYGGPRYEYPNTPETRERHGERAPIPFASGSGYLLSRDLVESIVYDKQRLLAYEREGLVDDVAVGKLLGEDHGVALDEPHPFVNYRGGDRASHRPLAHPGAFHYTFDGRRPEDLTTFHTLARALPEPRKRVEADRDVVCVVGMHRSGTSAMAGVLERLGGHIPEPKLGPAHDNEQGFYESAALVAIHDGMLAALGSGFHDTKPLPDTMTEDGALDRWRSELEAFLESELTAPLNVAKDPRLSRLLPIWKQAATGARLCVLHMLRHPAEAARSYAQREGCSLTHAVALWRRYNQAARDGAAGLPTVRVAYDELLGDWRATVARIERALSLSWPVAPEDAAREIERFLAGRLRHQNTRDLSDCEENERKAALALWEELTSDARPAPASRPWRSRVGGMWHEIGRLQFEFLRARGLRPEHRLLDVGCGSLRGGVHFARFLEPGHYCGLDRDESLLEAGKRELAAAGVSPDAARLSCRDDFVATGFDERFDFALAQSLFTHLDRESIRRCLVEVERVLAPGGRLFATFFEDPDGSHRDSPITHAPGGMTTYPDRNPYHYEFSTLRQLASEAGLEIDYVGDWDHPRAQKMAVFRRRALQPELLAGSDNPVISIVVVIYEMEREAPRTLHTLSPGYQGVSPELYEVIVVENGSQRPLGRERVEGLAENFRYVYLEPGNSSPVEALNLGARLGRGRLLGFMIDGARMLSPGVVQYALRAGRAYRNPVVTTVGYHLGPEPQPSLVARGWSRSEEDALLESVDWQHDGYQLFRISTPSASSHYGTLAPLAESNCLFVTDESYAAVGGFHRGYDGPGGGMVNLDFFREVIELPGTEWVMLLGEGNFHQFHDGEMTGRTADDATRKSDELFERYQQIRGRRFELPIAACDFLGNVPAPFRHVLEDALDRYRSFQQAEAEPAIWLDAIARPPNRLSPAEPLGRAVLILGMHRSGTSMLAGSLQAAGLELGAVNERARYNARGNRESPTIYALHEDLLARNGGSWLDVPEVVVWSDLHRAVRDHFIAGFDGAKAWGFKDPRTLLAIDGWLEALPDAERVGIFRHPLRVAESLRSRDDLPIERGLELWRVYNERLLALHSARPFPLIEFHEDAARVREAVRELAGELELPGRFRATGFFDDPLRQQQPIERELPRPYRELFAELRRRAARSPRPIKFQRRSADPS